MLNKFMNWLVPKLEDWCVRTGRVHTIMGRPGSGLENSPYLIRHFLFRSKYFSIYLHRFMRSDEGHHHDHPFNFVSYLVKGEYSESMLHREVFDTIPVLYWENTVKRKQGSLAMRPCSAIHMVSIDRPYSLEEKSDAPCTVVFRGAQKQEWEFYVPDPNFKHVFSRVPWQTYLNKTERDFE